MDEEDHGPATSSQGSPGTVTAINYPARAGSITTLPIRHIFSGLSHILFRERNNRGKLVS